MTNSIEEWQEGYGVITHSSDTANIVDTIINYYFAKDQNEEERVYSILNAADNICNMAMWMIVHQTYAKKAELDGSQLRTENFKQSPQGHTGGALNMVPAYVGYIAANAISHETRGWLMGQGHAVSAIEAVNIILGNNSQSHLDRYPLSQNGINNFIEDFYSYRINKEGKQESIIGSHVNESTAGGIMEGGYLGFASLQYPHMPLVGESLVAFLSDGAWEEQRGSDWAKAWWRPHDSGLICPVMILNGRRIDQRTIIWQFGGLDHFINHLKNYHFDPMVVDGRDPSAIAAAILIANKNLKDQVTMTNDISQLRIPYVIALAPKGAGFFGEGTNEAHNLPLVENPSKSEIAAARFNEYAKKLWVDIAKIKTSVKIICNHKNSNRALERDNSIANRQVVIKNLPEIVYIETERNCSDGILNNKRCPMDAADDFFIDLCNLNKNLRPRVGNPDELLSNRMDGVLKNLNMRTIYPEENMHESTKGDIVTILNEEAVIAAAIGNKGGINIAVTYEAFGAKMMGEIRQEITFSKRKKDSGQEVGWISFPLILTSHTWENSKNEISHQNTVMCEAMIGESSEVSRVLFPADYNSCYATMGACYATYGQIWTIVNAKTEMPSLLSSKESIMLLKNGAIKLDWLGYKQDSAKLWLVAIGSFQLLEIIKASERLTEKKIAHGVSYIIEPARMRDPRNPQEEAICLKDSNIMKIIPEGVKSLVVSVHCRPEIIRGVMHRTLVNYNASVLGFIGNGGTLSPEGMLFINKCSWAHIVNDSCKLLQKDCKDILSSDEIAALNHKKSPHGLIISKS